jgi:hypothetical protein
MRSQNIVAVAKIIIKFTSDCDIVALIIQNGKHMYLIIFSPVTCLPLPYFLHIIS